MLARFSGGSVKETLDFLNKVSACCGLTLSCNLKAKTDFYGTKTQHKPGSPPSPLGGVESHVPLERETHLRSVVVYDHGKHVISYL